MKKGSVPFLNGVSRFLAGNKSERWLRDMNIKRGCDSASPFVLQHQRAVLVTAASLSPFLKHCSGNRLGTLKGVAQTAVPSDVGHAAQCAAYTEQYGVEVILGQTVVHLDNAGLCVNVRPRVLGLAVLSQNARSNFKDLGDNFEQRVVFKARGVEAELTL
jgi:hypothetical protein